MLLKKKLIILQIDGLGYTDAKRAIRDGHMPFLKTLLNEEEYEILRYRSGVPSTTPYVQAGLLYGDNSEIPSFRWWDRKRKKTIQLLGERTFYDVEHRYFNNGKPLLTKGAAIASLFAGGSKSAFAVSYVDKGNSQLTNSLSKEIFMHLFLNPLQNLKWHWHSLKKSTKIGFEVVKSIVMRKYVDWIHFPLYLLDQLFLFYPTSIAVKKAIGANLPVTYAGFYTYDNVAHIFGQKSSHGNGILKDIDNTFKSISKAIKKKEECELIILSDHGETDFTYIVNKTGKTLAEMLSGIIPDYQIKEYPGKNIKPKTKIAGEIALTFSGGLAHFYDTAGAKRMTYNEINSKFPELLQKLVEINEIAGLVVKDEDEDKLITKNEVFSLKTPLSNNVKKFLKKFDNPEIVAKQLSDLNSFKNAGDIILIGQHYDNCQISFEPPVCGHGSIGGEQAHPFILLKKTHKLDTSNMTDARHLHPFLSSLVS
jgi:hypothetical protein